MKKIGLLIGTLFLLSATVVGAEKTVILVIPQEKFQDRELKETQEILAAQAWARELVTALISQTP